MYKRQGGKYAAQVVENALDRIVVQVQQLAEENGRSLRLSLSSASASTELPAPKASNVIGWNATADALVNYSPSSLATAVIAGTSYTDTFGGDGTTLVFPLTADPGSANALDVAISGVVQTPGLDFTVSGTTLTFASAPPSGTDNVMARYSAAIPVGSADAQDVIYLPGGTGAVATNVRTFLRNTVRVENYGADPTGVSSSNTAFGLAAQVVADNGGGDLLVGPGDFLLLNWELPAGCLLYTSPSPRD